VSQSDHSNWQHSGKNRWVAVILAYFLPFGIHQIYLGQYKKAVYIGLLCFIAIGIFIAWGQGIHYLIMGEEEFHRRLTMENKEFNEWKEQSKESEIDEFTVD
jgi:TM2 domain-containing membrane protein YozV